MSGCSYDGTCPNCNENMSMYSDHKPYDYVGGSCLYCGFDLYTITTQLTLDRVNDLRHEHNDGMDYVKGDGDFLEPLTELPEFDDCYENLKVEKANDLKLSRAELALEHSMQYMSESARAEVSMIQKGES